MAGLIHKAHHPDGTEDSALSRPVIIRYEEITTALIPYHVLAKPYGTALCKGRRLTV